MFIRIAICDDERAALDYISQTIEILIAPLDHTASIDCFPRSQLLMNALKNGAVYQIYFLDIEMPGMNGLELGEYINQVNKDSLYNIIYISNRLEKVFETFRTSPLRFIRKQYFYEEIPEALAASLEYITGESNETITLEIGTDVLRIPLRSIFYIESSNKEQIIMTSAAAHAVSTSMNQLEEELTPRGFIRAHRCYLVNCSHIYLIQQETILLDNRESIPLSKRRRKNVKEALLQYSQKKP